MIAPYSVKFILISKSFRMVNLLYKAEKPSVCLSVRLTVTLISQPCMHRLKPDLLEMKAESSGTAKYIFKSLHVRLLIHTSALKALV